VWSHHILGEFRVEGVANGDEGPTLRVDGQADVGTANPATIGATGGLIGAVFQGSSIDWPTYTGLGIRGGSHAAQLHGIADLGLVGAA